MAEDSTLLQLDIQELTNRLKHKKEAIDKLRTSLDKLERKVNELLQRFGR